MLQSLNQRKRRKSIPPKKLLCSVLTFLSLTSVNGFSQTATKDPSTPVRSDLEAKADDVSRDYQKRLLVLEGNVRINTGEDLLTADKATVNQRTQEIVAEGNVTLENKETYIEGEKIVYNYKTKTGEIVKGLVQSGQVVFVGDLIKRESEKHYIITRAKYTSCATCPAAWSFSGTEIDAEIGGYAYVKYPVLRIADFPVLILPRMLVPLKSERQSGFLVPKMSYSNRGGLGFNLPYFWAISRSQDMTYSLRNYERRGLKHQTEYRYVLGEHSRGILNGAYLKDRAFGEAGTGTSNTYSLDRGFLTYQHYYDMPDGFTHRAHLNLVSDLRYVRDFYDEISGHGDPALENSMSVTKNTDAQHFSVETTYYTNLLKSDGLADNDDAVHRFPEVRYSITERPLYFSQLYFNFDFNYVNFSRRNFSYDDVQIAGTDKDVLNTHNGFKPSEDLIRTGHRYMFLPSLSFPFHIGDYLDVRPSILYNETQYRFNADADQSLPSTDVNNYERNAERRFLQTDLSLKTKYSAVYGSDIPYANKYKHEIEPEVIYSKIPWSEQPDHPFFGTFKEQPYWRRFEAVSNKDFVSPSGLQFDYQDRFVDKDIATFVLSNYLVRKNYKGDKADYLKLTTFRLAQSYDFNEAKREDSNAWSTINGLLDVRSDQWLFNSTADYYPYAKVLNSSTRTAIYLQNNNYLELRFLDKAVVSTEENEKASARTRTVGASLGTQTKYLGIEGLGDYSLITSRFEKWQYIAYLKLPGDCLTFKFGHSKETGSDTRFDVSLNFNFGGI